MTPPDSHSEKFREATAAALRALARERHLGVTFTAGEVLDRPSESTKIAARLPIPGKKLDPAAQAVLRGGADRKALRLRHHDPALHTRLSPEDAEAAAVFDAIENARVEALGARGMAGVRANLARYLEQTKPLDGEAPPLAHAVNRYLFDRLSGTGEADGPWAAQLAGRITPDMLTDLDKSLPDQKAFAAAARQVLSAFGLAGGQADSEGDGAAEAEEQGEQQHGAPPPDEDGAPRPEEQEEAGLQDSSPDETDDGESEDGGEQAEETAEDSEAARGADLPPGAAERKENREADAHIAAYTAYTTHYDEVVKAEDLADPAELTRLRHALDEQLKPLIPVIGRLAHRLQRKLLARQQRSLRFDQEEGLLDAGKLPRMIANPNLGLSYKVEHQTPFRDTVVTLLIDNSGSMRGRPIAIAALCTDLIAQTLERCGIKVEVLGFTTRAWKGGRSRELWIDQGRPDRPGRLNDLRHIIYKGAAAPLRRTRRNFALMLKEGVLKENIDGEALVWAHNRLARRPEQRKILMVISDGSPIDDSTLSVNPPDYLEKDLRNVIHWVENLGQVELTAIGIGHDVTRYYRRALMIEGADELGPALVDRLEAMFDV